jgi:hypothetical protein
MPLEILAIMVVAGLCLVIGAVHFSGLSKTACITSREMAGARFNEDYPGEIPQEIVIATGGRAAFLRLANGRTGFVEAIGDRFLTRMFDADAIAWLENDGAKGIRLRFADLALPAATFTFGSDVEAAKVGRWLKDMANG